jgi:hypothetical protein
MSKTEQEKRISELRNKIANFEGGGAGSSPDGKFFQSNKWVFYANSFQAGQAAAESSGDEEESGSESEEE